MLTPSPLPLPLTETPTKVRAGCSRTVAPALATATAAVARPAAARLAEAEAAAPARAAVAGPVAGPEPAVGLPAGPSESPGRPARASPPTAPAAAAACTHPPSAHAIDRTSCSQQQAVACGGMRWHKGECVQGQTCSRCTSCSIAVAAAARVLSTASQSCTILAARSSAASARAEACPLHTPRPVWTQHAAGGAAGETVAPGWRSRENALRLPLQLELRPQLRQVAC